MRPETLVFYLMIAFLGSGCGEDTLPKPKAMLRLEYAGQAGRQLQLPCPFSFTYNEMAELRESGDCSFKLDYPQMKGAVFITYKKVKGNLDTLLRDAQKLSYEHVVKADQITEQPYINEENRVYGMLYDVQGDAASQTQFYLTDSTEHFLAGSLYFYARPNYDSLYPAAIYLQEDIRRMMESFRWK